MLNLDDDDTRRVQMKKLEIYVGSDLGGLLYVYLVSMGAVKL